MKERISHTQYLRFELRVVHFLLRKRSKLQYFGQKLQEMASSLRSSDQAQLLLTKTLDLVTNASTGDM